MLNLNKANFDEQSKRLVDRRNFYDKLFIIVWKITKLQTIESKFATNLILRYP